MKIWTRERIDYLRKIAPRQSNIDATTLVNKRFGTSFTVIQVKSAKKNHHISSELTGRFREGHVPMNKGRKQNEYMSPESIDRTKPTRFQKGHRPANHKPVGHERIDSKDGYILIKTREPNVFEHKHRVIWEKAYGPIPDGHNIVFLNGNRQDIRLDNLALTSKATNARINQSRLRFDDPDLTRSGLIVGELMTEIGRAKERLRRQANE